MSPKTTPARRILFGSRDLPFPTDPTFREYRTVQDLTGVTADQIMTGTAGVWMLPVLAIVALIRADRNVPRETLEKVLDYDASKITVTGLGSSEEDEDPNSEEGDVPVARRKKSTGTPSTIETLEESGTPESATTSD